MVRTAKSAPYLGNVGLGGIAFHAADTLMRDDADQQRLAHEALALARGLA